MSSATRLPSAAEERQAASNSVHLRSRSPARSRWAGPRTRSRTTTFIATTTVQTHARSAMRKVGARSQAQLVAILFAELQPGPLRPVRPLRASLRRGAIWPRPGRCSRVRAVFRRTSSSATCSGDQSSSRLVEAVLARAPQWPECGLAVRAQVADLGPRFDRHELAAGQLVEAGCEVRARFAVEVPICSATSARVTPPWSAMRASRQGAAGRRPLKLAGRENSVRQSCSHRQHRAQLEKA